MAKRFNYVIFAAVMLSSLNVFAQGNWRTVYDRSVQNFDQENYKEALKIGLDALKMARSENGDEHESVAITYHNVARIYGIQKRYRRAGVYYKRAIAVKEKLVSPDDETLISYLMELGDLYNNQGNFVAAQPIFDQVYSSISQSDDALKRASITEKLGVLYRIQGDFQKAEPFYTEALNLYKNLPNIPVEKRITLMTDLGAIFGSNSRHNEAISLYEEILTLKAQEYGAKSIEVAEAHQQFAVLYAGIPDNDNAEKHFKLSFEMKMKVLGVNHPDVEDALVEYNDFRLQIGKSLFTVDTNPRVMLGFTGGYFGSFIKNFRKDYINRPIIGAALQLKMSRNFYAVFQYNWMTTDKISGPRDPSELLPNEMQTRAGLRTAFDQFIQNYGLRYLKSDIFPIRGSKTWIGAGVSMLKFELNQSWWVTQGGGQNPDGTIKWVDIRKANDLARDTNGYYFEIGQMFQGDIGQLGSSHRLGISVNLKYDTGRTIPHNIGGVTVQLGASYLFR